jgi:YHS domain-containing protein
MKTLITIVALQVIGLAAYAAGSSDSYPLTTCVVSGEKLGEMGKPYVFEYKGQEVQLCCEHCKAKFEKNPDKYLEKLGNPAKGN